MRPDPRGFVESLFTLQHTYDPVKAREYYLKTRKLKGRNKAGTVFETELDDPKAPKTKPTGPVSKSEAKKIKKVWANKEDQERVDKLQKRFAHLQNLLAELVQEKSRTEGPVSDGKGTGTGKASKEEKSTGGSPSKHDDKPKTAKQKREAAAAAKKAYEKERDPSLSAQAKALDAKIKDVGEAIKKMRAEVKKAQKKDQAKPDAKK
jgi:hypothetical protein